ncbi:MAG TPA: hypothetical protein VGA70_09165 [Longimicrobiales bacterium]
MSRPAATLLRLRERAVCRVRRTALFQRVHGAMRLPLPTLDRPVFLVGTVRSGTTLVARSLGDGDPPPMTGRPGAL